MSEGNTGKGGSLRRILVFEDRRAMVGYLVQKWHEISRDAVQRKGFFAVALSGGKTPEDFYRGITGHKEAVPWEKTHIFFVDERFVPAADKDSNYRMIRDALLTRVPLPAKNVHSIPTDGPDPVISAKKYEEDLRIFFGVSSDGLPEFDLIILGIGKDGHTASLFPGSPLLAGPGGLARAVLLGQEKHDRITLTLPVINNAKNVLFLVTGKEKAEAVRGATGKRDPALPASLVRPSRGNLLIMADSGAGMLLFEKEYEKG